MAVLVALTVGLGWWIAAWSFGVKAFDAFLLAIALVLGTATVRMVIPFVRQLLGRDVAGPAEQGAGER
jgi:hypothetical protein